MNQLVESQKLEIGGYTDIGRRDRNEDTFLIDRELGLVIVAAGLAGIGTWLRSEQPADIET